jgi:hypothetical protein
LALGVLRIPILRIRVLARGVLGIDGAALGVAGVGRCSGSHDPDAFARARRRLILELVVAPVSHATPLTSATAVTDL